MTRAERERDNEAYRQQRNSHHFENVRETPLYPNESISANDYREHPRYYPPEAFDGPMPPRFFGETLWEPQPQPEPPRGREDRGRTRRAEGVYGPPEGYPPQGFPPPPPPPPPHFYPAPPPPHGFPPPPPHGYM